MQCVNKNLREYQTLKKESGLSDSELSHQVGMFLDNVGRYPYLDELDGANSEPAIREDLKLNKDNITSVQNILKVTHTTTIDDATQVLNNKYRDKEIEIDVTNNTAKVFITERPGLNPKDASLYDSLENEMNVIKQKAIANGTFMKAPNGKDTNLTERQWLQVRTKNFKNWFGDWLSFNKSNPYSTNIHIGEFENDFSNADASGIGKVIPIYLGNNWIGESGFDNSLSDSSPYLDMPSVGGSNITIEEEYRGKGYGKAAYFEIAKLAANNGKILRSAPDASRTPASTRVWESLVRDGYAKKTGDRYEFINSSLSNASKVVDENGEPLVVYHNGVSDIRTFKGDSFGLSYFGDSLTSATYGGGETSVFLNIKNPEIIEGKGEEIGDITEKKYKSKRISPPKNKDGVIYKNVKDVGEGIYDWDYEDVDLFWKQYEEQGYGTVYSVQNPNQIKSATDNSGEFSTKINDITDGEVNSFHYFNEIIDKLNTLYGINVIPITNQELKDSDLGKIAGNAKAFIYNGDIYVNVDIATVDSPVHEFLHILFGSLKYSNRELYNQIVSQAEQFDTYGEISQEYPNRTREDVNEEVFVTELAKYLTGRSNTISKLPQNIQHEIFYNINRTLDTMLMGNISTRCISGDQLYQMNLKSLAQLVDASTIQNNFQTTLTNSALSRIMSNKKHELMNEGLLKEECS